MSGKPYDLQSLLYEIQQSLLAGRTDAQDLTRAADLVLDRLGCATAEEAWERLHTDWKALVHGTAMSGMRAGQILAVLPMLRYHRPVGEQHQLDELQREAEAHGPGDRWRASIAAVNSMSGLQRIETPAEMEAAIARIEQNRDAFPPGSRERDALDAAHAGLRAHLAQTGGGEDDFDSAVEDLARLRNSPSFDAGMRQGFDGQLAVFRSHQAVRREDETALARHIGELEAVVAQLSPDHMDRIGMESNLDVARANLEILRSRRTGRLFPDSSGMVATPDLDEVRRQIALLPREGQADRLGEAGASSVGRALFAGNARGAIEAMRLLQDALDLLEPDDERWIRNAQALGTAHLFLGGMASVPRADRPGHLDQGISWLKHTLRLAGGPAHPLWNSLGMSLASGYRFRGDNQVLDARATRLNHAESRRVGLDALRAATWSVLLQSGTVHAAETGRRAGEQALGVARWCLADGAHDDAVRALDAGRGLVLHAATVAATVPDMLDALGQSGPADEWRAAGGVAPEPGPEAAATAPPPASGPSSRLRRRVLQALAASPHRQRLLDVPAIADIGRALHAMGRTALVYLVPGGDGVPGTALIVSADGTAKALKLPRLTVSDDALTGYRSTGAPGRTAGGPTASTPRPQPPTQGEGRAALERLCDWAGEAVMEPLLKEVSRRRGRVPAMVLVPMAELGVVPWHAARLSGRHGAHRYACHEAEISYTPSARLLCEVATRPSAGTRQALVVGDPTRDLLHAGKEAEAIFRTFYPDGELLGPGTATPAAVADWLGRQRGGLLHLACHGEVRQGLRNSAYLKLSGGHLNAEELTEGTARYRHLELVVLAACSTNVSGHGYDEAYSLSTAFLVAGARSVLGSLWPVPDAATSVLMYMTHHYMCRERRTPGQALRDAQLWMLDKGRRTPAGMPADMAARVPLIDAADPTGWAGFTHLGW
ncbi:CHAT domain-containing protein [Streptomyces sp. NBC_01591]|uniref:CHAT domain-containing protein n=1 Tax=Streptomyces sp. NBC_01591 TaxID=2975888 RepID=UPI002DD88F3F|nr:CHAT domain-containing protein [Streptomyces sp. NBC_01591]WSD71011.1 CHAT domain-containing protein [Streptomyces sp. NBC_01591]